MSLAPFCISQVANQGLRPQVDPIQQVGLVTAHIDRACPVADGDTIEDK